MLNHQKQKKSMPVFILATVNSSVFGNHRFGTLPTQVVGFRKTILCCLLAVLINALLFGPAAAQATGRMKQELKKFTRPSVLILDELGFLPIDKAGADLPYLQPFRHCSLAL